jgi:outer membrane protein
MKFFKRVFIFLFAFWIIGAVPLFAENQGIKIGVIDLKKIVKQSLYGKSVMEKLQQKYESLSKKIREKFKELEKLKNEIETKSSLWSESVRQEKQRFYQKKLRDLKALQEDSQYEMKNLEKKLLEPVFAELEKVIKDFVKRKHYDLILEKNQPGLYYASPKVDLTSKIIKLFDEYYLNRVKNKKEE